ncbi:hypothetical protein SVAN01_07036 [Stagonosporopsis vannaccii]|nr:hypothetical protein SVAN01_07036 [Stagonosporopsis vannaccii]
MKACNIGATVAKDAGASRKGISLAQLVLPTCKPPSVVIPCWVSPVFIADVDNNGDSVTVRKAADLDIASAVGSTISCSVSAHTFSSGPWKRTCLKTAPVVFGLALAIIFVIPA